MFSRTHWFGTLLALAVVGAPLSHARDLTFEERVGAQEAIERVYYSHQIGAERLFEEAVPRDLLERKVVRHRLPLQLVKELRRQA